MKKKIFTAIGLMSGTSMDGIDLSLIKSDGYNHIEQINDEYYEFSDELYKELFLLREDIKKSEDLIKYSAKLEEIEKNFTLFNAKVVNEFIKKKDIKPDFIGFHGQTIFHQPSEKISKQIGEGHLLSQLTKCTVINKFRQKDIESNGQGAPLAPIFHYLISKKIKEEFNLNYPINIINIGGISNVTSILNNENVEKDIFAYDIGPGNCLIDQWLKKNSNKKFDENGTIASLGEPNDLILNQAKDNFEILSINESLDINDFDISFVKGLNLEDGCATLNKFTAYLISEGLKKIDEINKIKTENFVMCGGGRKNLTLIKNIKQFMDNEMLTIKNIDDFKINGDFVESQAFAYLAIRCFLNLPISFPNTTRCEKLSSGGNIIKNF